MARWDGFGEYIVHCESLLDNVDQSIRGNASLSKGDLLIRLFTRQLQGRSCQDGGRELSEEASKIRFPNAVE